MNVKREIPLEEVEGNPHYSDIAELARIFNHAVVEDEGTWWWRENRLVTLLTDGTPVYQAGKYGGWTETLRMRLDMNRLWDDFRAGRFGVEELVKWYMGIGYSLSGFCEVFGQRKATEVDLPGEGGESVIDYLVRAYRGQVLKI